MQLSTYSDLRDSNVPWIQSVPSHWTQRRLKFVVELVNQKQSVDQSDLPYIGLEHIESWTGRKIDGEISQSEGLASTYTSGDVLFGKLRPYLAKIHLADTPGLVSSEALVIRPSSDISSSFLKYYFLSRDFINTVDSSTYGSKMPRASWDYIGNLPLLIPSAQEQQAIVGFLDHKTAQIDALIAKKQSLLNKLAEQRTALISQAVTKGFDPSVSMKDSGVDWLGEIPAHWMMTKLRFVINDIEQGWSPQCHNQSADEDQWGVLKVGCVNGEEFNPNENKALPEELEPRQRYEIKPGDILVSRANTKELLGSAALVKTVQKKLLLCDKLYRIKPSEKIDSSYLLRFLRSSIARYQYEKDATGTSGSMQNIGQDTIKNMSLPLPPLPEQISIAKTLQHEYTKGFVVETKIKSVIHRLQEYRSALITNVVTGKIDVRDFCPPATTEQREVAHG